MSAPAGVYLLTGDSGPREEIAQRANGGAGAAGSPRRQRRRCGSGRRPCDVAEMDRLGIRQPDDRRGMKALADDEALGEMLMEALAGEDRRRVVRRRARGVAAVPDEIVLRLRPDRRPRFSLGGSENPGPFAIEIDQLLRDRLAFRRIGMQQVRRAALAQDGGELPAEIEGVLHRDVHALPRLRAVGVAGIAGDEDARQARCDLGLRHVVELVASAAGRSRRPTTRRSPSRRAYAD